MTMHSSFSVISVMLLATASAMQLDMSSFMEDLSQMQPEEESGELSESHFKDMINQLFAQCEGSVRQFLEHADSTKHSDCAKMAEGFCADAKTALGEHRLTTSLILADREEQKAKGNRNALPEMMHDFLSASSSHEGCLKAMGDIMARVDRPSLDAHRKHELADQFCSAGEKFEEQHTTVFLAMDEVSKRHVKSYREAHLSPENLPPLNQETSEDATRELKSEFNSLFSLPRSFADLIPQCETGVRRFLEQARATKDASNRSEIASSFCADAQEEIDKHRLMTGFLLADHAEARATDDHTALPRLMHEIMSDITDDAGCVTAMEKMLIRVPASSQINPSQKILMAKRFCKDGERFQSEHATVFAAMNEVAKRQIEAFQKTHYLKA